MRFAILIAFLANAASAECPMVPDHEAALSSLIEATRDSPNASVAQQHAGDMWQLWLDAPDEQSQEMLDSGMQRRNVGDFLGAIQELDALVSYCPDYAEGYNQRAFTYFLQQRFALALDDLDKALVLQPRHVGALSGRALTLMHLGRPGEGRQQMLDALELNPWLSERALLEPGAPLGPVGQDI